jgi:hypothetical protein
MCLAPLTRVAREIAISIGRRNRLLEKKSDFPNCPFSFPPQEIGTIF